MSKVLLLASSPNDNNPIYFPYALLFLRSALEKNGHQVAIVDFQLGAEAYALFRTELLKKPDVLGVSLFCGPGVSLAQKASRLCRKLSPDTCIVWGGILPTISPEMVFTEKSVDYVIGYEGEESLPLFVDALERNAVRGNVPNLAYRDGDKLVIPPPPAKCVDLNNFLPIDFTGATNSKYISTHFFIGKRVASIFTSRGCPYNCTFCYNTYFNQRHWRPFPVDWILDTVDKLVDNFHVDGLLAFDDNFFVDPDRARQILEKVRARGHRINWFAELRVDQVLNMSVQELRELQALGLTLAYVGVESGCDRILKLFNKKITGDDAREANRKLAQTDIAPYYTFIIGAPTETQTETLETVDLAMELIAENPRAALWQFNQYTPYPGTALYETAIKNGFRRYESLEDWDVGWTLRDANLSSTTFRKSEMETLRYAALFQKPDLYFTNFPLPVRSICRALRKIFEARLRRHVFYPFLDTWAVGTLVHLSQSVHRYRFSKAGDELLDGEPIK